METAAISGFGPGAMIMTADGELPVEWLEKGDRIITRDHGMQPILHIARSKSRMRNGAGLPTPLRLNRTTAAGQEGLIEPLRLSPHSLVRVCHPQVALHFGCDDAVAQIGDLSRRQYAQDDPDCPAPTYHHIVMAHHELIWCCGIWVASTGTTTAAQLDLPPPLLERTKSFFTPRMCLNASEATMLRQKLLPEETVMRLIAA